MVDPLIVVQVVAGSNPVSHPIFLPPNEKGGRFFTRMGKMFRLFYLPKLLEEKYAPGTIVPGAFLIEEVKALHNPMGVFAFVRFERVVRMCGF